MDYCIQVSGSGCPSFFGISCFAVASCIWGHQQHQRQVPGFTTSELNRAGKLYLACTHDTSDGMGS